MKIERSNLTKRWWNAANILFACYRKSWRRVICKDFSFRKITTLFSDLVTYERRIGLYKLISKIKFDVLTTVISSYDLMHLFDIYIYNLICCNQRSLYIILSIALFLICRQFPLFPNKEFYWYIRSKSISRLFHFCFFKSVKIWEKIITG